MDESAVLIPDFLRQLYRTQRVQLLWLERAQTEPVLGPYLWAVEREDASGP